MGEGTSSLLSHRLEGAASGKEGPATTAECARLGLQTALSWYQAAVNIWRRLS